MKRRLLVLACCLAFPGLAAAELVDRIVAVVNSEVVTSVQLDRAIAERRAGIAPTQLLTDGEALRRAALDQLIEERLLAQRARELELSVSDDEVETAIQDVQRQNRLTRPQLEDALRQQNIVFADYRENLRRQILRFKVLGREMQSRTDVTSRDIRDYYQQHLDEFRLPPTLTLSRISFPLPDKAGAAEKVALRLQAEPFRQRLAAGEGFAEVLAAASATGGEGGDLGTVAEAELNPAFADAVRSLKPGEVSPLVETPAGIHIFLLTGRTLGQVTPLEEVKERIRDTLAEGKREDAVKKWLAELRAKARIELR